MKHTFLLCLLIAICSLSYSQDNPYSKYGYEPQIATMTNGKFIEIHDQDTIVQIGSVLYNTMSKEIIGFVEYDTLYSEATLAPDVVSRWLSPDPMQHMRMWVSPYNFVQNNPIMRIDPDGRLDGEYEKGSDGQWNKISTKGDDIGVDFYHTDYKNKDGKQMTLVTDRKGNFNTIADGRYTLSGTQRSEETNWQTIYSEWETGTGPETSFFEGDHQTIKGFKDHYLMDEAFNKFQESGFEKGRYEAGFTLFDAIKTGDKIEQAQAQMMGNYNISFYKLGNRTLSIIQDSKSRSSMFYHLPFIQNYNRGEKPTDNESNTFQNYLFFKN